jgi:thiamine biosynthesis lipoprotein
MSARRHGPPPTLTPGIGWRPLREARSPVWTATPAGHRDVIALERSALGTSARVVVWPPQVVSAVLAAVDRELADLDRQVSRFRPDSELRTAERNAGRPTTLTQGAADALAMALAAARVSRGLVDPTVGSSLGALGYDRDFAAIVDGAGDPGTPQPAPGWRVVGLRGRVLNLPSGVQLDLGATAKGLGADRAARAAAAAAGRGGVLVDLGGDIAVAGVPPAAGWPIAVAEDPGPAPSGSPIVRVRAGGLATSSVRHRRWRQSGQVRHHIVDPATGSPTEGRWRTATVGARTCLEANVASTAALVAGEGAEAWLTGHGLPARLVSADGDVRLVGPWPTEDQGLVLVPERSIFEVLGQRGLR